MAPYVNSYRRYVKDHAAPINLSWGRDNRTTGIRIPLSGPAARRIENRLAGMDCNPYLGIAASLACGYLGLTQELRPDKQQRGDAYSDEPDIPQVMGQALDLFDTAPQLFQNLQRFLTERFPDLTEEGSVLRQSLSAIGETIQSKGGELLNTALSSLGSLISIVTLGIGLVFYVFRTLRLCFNRTRLVYI